MLRDLNVSKPTEAYTRINSYTGWTKKGTYVQIKVCSPKSVGCAHLQFEAFGPPYIPDSCTITFAEPGTSSKQLAVLVWRVDCVSRANSAPCLHR